MAELKDKDFGIETGNDFYDYEAKYSEDVGTVVTVPAKNVPDELFERMRAVFSEETLVVITAMGVFMIANNVFNDVLRVEPEPIQ